MATAALIIVFFAGVVALGERVRLRFALRALIHRRTSFRLNELKPLPSGISLREFRPDDHDP
jgi:hypothetical protein